MMNAEEQEYMDYLIHNRTQLTNQITRHLDEIDVLQKKLAIATKALKKIDPEIVPFKDFNHRGAILYSIARQALKEIEEVK